MLKKYIILLLLIFNSCGNHTNSIDLEAEEQISETQYFRVPTPTSCDLGSQNQFIYDVMHDSYLWANEVPIFDDTNITETTPDQLLVQLKNSKDHFSFIIDQQTAQNYFEIGENDNFGFSIKLINLENGNYGLIVSFVYPNSPADYANFKRSNLITQINHQAITPENLQSIATLLDQESTIEFGLLSQEGEITYTTLTKESYTIETILYHDIIDQEEKKIGYMVFQDFIDLAMPEIDKQFNEFKIEQIDELILDLRYNGGGSVDVARHLASLIGGFHVVNKVFHHVNLNERYSKYNFTSYFEPYQPNALNLNRIFILTTKSSCSASELVINALRASINHVEVIQIGEATCGKPYGFIGAGLFCEKALYAINMETRNSDNVGDYINGISPTCLAQDDLLHDFGDPNERLLASALKYIQTNTCDLSTPLQKQTLKSKELPNQHTFKRLMPAY